jgi:hypothetical protein
MGLFSEGVSAGMTTRRGATEPPTLAGVCTPDTGLDELDIPL